MSIVVRFKPSSLTAATYDATTRQLAEAGVDPRPDGLDRHICFGTDGNLQVIELWDSREQFEAFGDRLRELPVLASSASILGRRRSSTCTRSCSASGAEGDSGSPGANTRSVRPPGLDSTAMAGCRRARRPRRPRAQPQGHHRPPAAERAGLHHRAVRLRASRSLAFDTIYAEGQRRYVESLSAYARQFLQMMEKPDVDSIDGLSPGDLDRPEDDVAEPALDRRHGHGDLRLPAPALRARRAGRTARSAGGRSPARASEAIVDQILQLPEGTRFTVNAPVVRDRKGEYREVFEELRSEGFTRVKVDGEQRLLEEPIELDKKFKHTIEVVVDRLVMKPDLRTRPGAVGRDGGRARRGASSTIDVDRRRAACSSPRTSPAPSTASRCPSSSRASSRSTRRTAPARAAPASARSRRSTRTCSCPTRRCRDRRGALVPVVGRQLGFYEAVDPGDRRPLRDRPRHALARS